MLKQQFCCREHSIGCIHTTQLPFNCFVGFSASAFLIQSSMNVALGLRLLFLDAPDLGCQVDKDGLDRWFDFSGELHLAWSVSKKALTTTFGRFRRRAGAASTSKGAVPPLAWPPPCPTTAPRLPHPGDCFLRFRGLRALEDGLVRGEEALVLRSLRQSLRPQGGQTNPLAFVALRRPRSPLIATPAGRAGSGSSDVSAQWMGLRGWTVAKKRWCCVHTKRACDPYD